MHWIWALSSRLDGHFILSASFYWQELVPDPRMHTATHSAQDFFLADIASMCSQLQQKYSLHIDQTLMVPLAGFKVYQSTMHTEETKWDVSSCHSDSPMGVKTCLPASASLNSFPRDHHEPLVETVLPYPLNQLGNTTKAQYYPSSIPLSNQCNSELICSLSVPRSSGSDTINQSLICS